MKLLLIKVLILALTTDNGVHSQAQDSNRPVTSLRGSVFVQGDMFLAEDEDSTTCIPAGGRCNPNADACCNGWFCDRENNTCKYKTDSGLDTKALLFIEESSTTTCIPDGQTCTPGAINSTRYACCHGMFCNPNTLKC